MLEVEEIASPDAAAIEDDIHTLLDGVTAIGTSGTPGALCVYGSNAFPLVVGTYQGHPAAIVAAGRHGDGRVVALGHEGFLLSKELESRDTGRLVTNALDWAAGGGPGAPRVGVVDEIGLHLWLKRAGYNVVTASLTPDSLEAIDVVVVVMSRQTESELGNLSEFLNGGGGGVIAGNGWGWAYLNPRLRLANDFPGNQLIARFGMRWADAQVAQPSGGFCSCRGTAGIHARGLGSRRARGGRPATLAGRGRSGAAQHPVDLRLLACRWRATRPATASVDARDGSGAGGNDNACPKAGGCSNRVAGRGRDGDQGVEPHAGCDAGDVECRPTGAHGLPRELGEVGR